MYFGIESPVILYVLCIFCIAGGKLCNSYVVKFILTETTVQQKEKSRLSAECLYHITK